MEAVWAYVERRLCPYWAKSSHLGLMLGQVGPMLRHRAQLGPIFAQVGPMLGYVGPILGACWGPMLGDNVGLGWPMLSPLGSYVGAMFGP